MRCESTMVCSEEPKATPSADEMSTEGQESLMRPALCPLAVVLVVHGHGGVCVARQPL